MPTRDELLPQVIRHLRESKRMTIDMVASYLEVETNDIKQYEAGEKKLRPALFIGLSALFKIPLNVFELKQPEGNSVFHYRRTINNKELEYYSYTLYGYMNNILKIYSSNQIDVFKLPYSQDVNDFDKNLIKESSLNLREALHLSHDEPIPNLPKILDELGIEVIYTELPVGINGVSYTLNNQDSKSNSIIFFISNDDNLFKQSFSIAHEFGHVMMHSNIQDTNEELEKIANYFANVFLLPPDTIIPELCNIFNNRFDNNSIKEEMRQNSRLYGICNKYGVSVKTLLWSLYNAEKINEELLKQLCYEYDNLTQDQRLIVSSGRKDCQSYNNKMLEAVEKNIISKKEYGFITGFDNNNNIIISESVGI